jgi:hypothetical protein
MNCGVDLTFVVNPFVWIRSSIVKAGGRAMGRDAAGVHDG